MKAQKIHTCRPKLYTIINCSTSAVTKAFMRTTAYKYQKGMGTKNKNDLSTRAWYIRYQGFTTINNKYKRVTEADTHKIPKLYAIKTEKRASVLSIRRDRIIFHVSSTEVLHN